MRLLILAFALTATACAKEDPAVAPGLEAGTYMGSDRDALCIAGAAGAQRAGFIVYGAGDANCSASGRIERKGTSWDLVPQGEGDCRIAFSVNGNRISLGPGHPSCAYYCGGGATFDGKSFRPSADDRAVTDLAGDPLC